MLLRDMVHLAKVNGSIWSQAMIEQKVRALGSIKRYQPKSLIIHEEEKLVFYNRVERFYLDVNFEKLVYADRDYYTEQEYATRFAVPLEPLATVSEPEYFNSEQLSRIETMKKEIPRFYPYGQGDFIYNNLGIFRDGEDDRWIGMIICVPEGNPNKTLTGFWEDSTRLPEFYNGTYRYLKSIGIEEI